MARNNPVGPVPREEVRDLPVFKFVPREEPEDTEWLDALEFSPSPGGFRPEVRRRWKEGGP